jgi:uncharacterized protein YjgD (DUF1641 family)
MDPIDRTIEALILSGALEVSGIDSKTQEPLYSFNPKIQKIMPELYREHLNEVNRNIMILWEKGFLDVSLLESDPLVTLTNKAFNDVEIQKIPIEEQVSLLEIKRLLVK